MKVSGYVRVSTTMQSDEGCSLDSQRDRITRWCAAYGHTLVAIHEDAGISGAKDIDRRPGLAAALADINEGRAEVLVVTKLDRLCRSMRILVTLVDGVFKDKGLVSLSENVDTTTAMGRAFVQFCGLMAELERGLISERVTATMSFLKGQGVRFGAAPLGYRLTDEIDAAGRRLLEPDEEEAATVERIRELRREGESLRAIAQIITAEGRKSKRGGKFAAATIARILRRAGAGEVNRAA